MAQTLFYYGAGLAKHFSLASFLSIPVVFCLGGILLFNLEATIYVFNFFNIGAGHSEGLLITHTDILTLYTRIFPIIVVLGLLFDFFKFDITQERLYAFNFLIHGIGLAGALTASSQLTGFNESWTFIVPIIAGLYFVSFLSGSLYIFLNHAINRLIKLLQKTPLEVQR